MTTPTSSLTSQEAKTYQHTKNVLFLLQLLFSGALLLSVIAWGLPIFLRAYIRMYVDDEFVLRVLFLLAFSGFMNIMLFPLEWYEGFMLEHRFKLSTQSFMQWLGDYGKKLCVTSVVYGVIVLGAYAIIDRFPVWWWFIAIVFWLIVTIVFNTLFPHFILPLFFKSHPLPQEPLRDRLLALAQKCHFPISDILVLELSAKTVKANAMITGLGRSKRIFLSDTLLKDFSIDEIEVVLAHEIAHYQHRDMLKHIFIASIVALLGFFCVDRLLSHSIAYFGFWGKSDIATLPLVLLLISAVGFVVLPVQNALLRHFESQADKAALRQVAQPEAFISLMTKLGKKNLADFSPSKIIELFLYDHPPLAQRIAKAQTRINANA